MNGDPPDSPRRDEEDRPESVDPRTPATEMTPGAVEPSAAAEATPATEVTPAPAAEEALTGSESTSFIGEMIGDYRIVRKLGEGGMGIVFEAEQQSPRRPVALKVIRSGRYVSETEVKLFRREAQALARLKHPAIASIYENGRTPEGQHFFAMELVRSEPLSTLVTDQKDTEVVLGAAHAGGQAAAVPAHLRRGQLRAPTRRHPP